MLAVALGAVSVGADMGTQIGEIRAVGPTVSAAITINDAFPDKFKDVLQSGKTLHLRVQMELWEDRPVWDRLVRPAIVTVFRIVRDPATAHLAISDAVGRVLSVNGYSQAVPLLVDAAPSDAVADSSRYYLRMIATIGTLPERDIERTGEAVFGRDEGTLSLGKVGKFIFHTVLQITDYLQSVSSEARSRIFQGREIKPPRK